MGIFEPAPAQGERGIDGPPIHSEEGGVPKSAREESDDDMSIVRTPRSVDERMQKSAIEVYPVSIAISNLRPGGQAVINLRDEAAATWRSDDSTGKASKVSVESSAGGIFALNNFVVNSRVLLLDVYDTCEEIRLQLYVSSSESIVFGSVDLPPAASVTIASAVDRTTVIGLSSFALTCRERIQGGR